MGLSWRGCPASAGASRRGIGRDRRSGAILGPSRSSLTPGPSVDRSRRLPGLAPAPRRRPAPPPRSCPAGPRPPGPPPPSISPGPPPVAPTRALASDPSASSRPPPPGLSIGNKLTWSFPRHPIYIINNGRTLFFLCVCHILPAMSSHRRRLRLVVYINGPRGSWPG